MACSPAASTATSSKDIGHPSTGLSDRLTRSGLPDLAAWIPTATSVCFHLHHHSVSLLVPQALRADSVEMTGFEPVTFALQRRCSPAELHPQGLPGPVGLTGFEPVTPALSAQCSNQLSYKPGEILTTE